MSSCRLAGVNVWDYLVAVVSNRAQVRASPGEWLPWAWAAREREARPAA